MSQEIIPRNSSVYTRHLIARVRHLTLWARQRELDAFNISPEQAYILLLIHNLGRKTTLAELTKYTGRRLSTLSVQLTKMEKNGLVKKFRATPNSNLVMFELTEKGFNVYKKSIKMKSDKAIMSVLSEEERQQLISLLKRIKEEAEKYKQSLENK